MPSNIIFPTRSDDIENGFHRGNALYAPVLQVYGLWCSWPFPLDALLQSRAATLQLVME